jgi:hypothetical protein
VDEFILLLKRCSAFFSVIIENLNVAYYAIIDHTFQTAMLMQQGPGQHVPPASLEIAFS